MNQDELLARLNGFEWNDLECKRAQRGLPDDAYRTVSAFANTAGGWLIFGVSEAAGQLVVTGVETPDKVQNDFLGTLRGGQKLNRAIAVEALRFEIDGMHVFAFHVPQSPRFDEPVYLKGDPRHTYIRRGAGDEQCTPSERERFLHEASQDRYDGVALPGIPVERCFDLETVKWYQAQFARRTPEHAEIGNPTEFLLNWNFLVERDGHMLPTRANILLFGEGRFVRQILPRPVLDYQRIDTSFDQWSAEQRWHDCYVFEENVFRTWQGLVARYMRIAEHPFSLEPATLRRNDDPPDYVAFCKAAINLLIHQDYGDHGRKASIRLFTDRTIFWNPGDAFATEAELLDPTEVEVRNPSVVKAFRRIGLSDQAGTGIRAIFRNWHDLGRVPPQLTNDKVRKDFELVLVNQPLVSETMQRFCQTIGANLTREQADLLALGQPPGDHVSLTDIRDLGVNTTQQAKQIAGFLVRQQPLQQVGETLFEVHETVWQRFTLSAETGTPQVAPQVSELLKSVAGEMTRQELMDLAGLKDRKHFTDVYLQPALGSSLLEMTIADKPQSSKQSYRLTAQGQAAVARGDA